MKSFSGNKSDYNSYKTDYEEVKSILNDCFGTNNKLTKFKIEFICNYLEKSGISIDDFENTMKENCIYFDGVPSLNDILKYFPVEQHKGCSECKNGWIENKYDAFPCKKCNESSYKEMLSYKLKMYQDMNLSSFEEFEKERNEMNLMELSNNKFYSESECKKNKMVQKYLKKEVFEDDIED